MQSKTNQTEFVLGFHAAKEVLEAKQVVYQAYLQKGLTSKRMQNFIEQLNRARIPISEQSKKELDHYAMGMNHQGVILEVEPYVYQSVDFILNKAKEKQEDPFLIILNNIEDPHNLGSILRTADASGVHGVIIPKHRSASVTASVLKTSTGAAYHVPIARVTNLTQTIDDLKKKGVWVFGTDMKGQFLWEMDATLPLAIVIGNEGKGLSRRVKQHLDGMLTIPMRGHVQSLNASVAAALMMYEVYHRRSL